MNTAVLEVPKFRRERYINISLKEYREKLEDARLLAIAEERMKHYNPNTLVSFEEVLEKEGITKEDLKGWEDVEIE